MPSTYLRHVAGWATFFPIPVSLAIVDLDLVPIFGQYSSTALPDDPPGAPSEMGGHNISLRIEAYRDGNTAFEAAGVNSDTIPQAVEVAGAAVDPSQSSSSSW